MTTVGLGPALGGTGRGGKDGGAGFTTTGFGIIERGGIGLGTGAGRIAFADVRLGTFFMLALCALDFGAGLATVFGACLATGFAAGRGVTFTTAFALTAGFGLAASFALDADFTAAFGDALDAVFGRAGLAAGLVALFLVLDWVLATLVSLPG